MAEKRSCAFCGGSPVTKEHGLPRWLDKIMPVRRVLRQTHLKGDVRGGEGVIKKSERGSRRTVSGNEVRAFCESCNTGWMSRLEMKSAKILGPMILGHGTAMPEDAQKIVAAWILKTCLVHLAATDMWHDWKAEYATFYATKIPSSHHAVFVGGFMGQDWPTLCHFQPLAVSDGTKGAVPVDAYLATVAIGHFVGQVFHLPTMFGSSAKLKPPNRMVRVWPVSDGFIWPRGFFSSAELKLLAETRLPPIDCHNDPQADWS